MYYTENSHNDNCIFANNTTQTDLKKLLHDFSTQYNTVGHLEVFK